MSAAESNPPNDADAMDGRYYGVPRSGLVYKAPVATPSLDGGTTISIGFPVCRMHDAAGREAAVTVAKLLNIGERLQWRDMSTAPRDGSTFLAVVDGAVRLVCWNIVGFSIDDEAEGYPLVEPARWMHMPEVS